MSTTKKQRPANRQSKAAARKLFTAVDRLIAAAKQAEQARNELSRNVGNRKG